jgi:hypothetical protein
MAKSKIAKYRKKNRPNPGATTELAYKVGAGFAGYTATRFLTRMAFAQAVKKFPKNANHAALVASAASAAGIWFGSQKWDKVSDYHEEISIGAGIALAQTAIHTLLPQYAWIVGDLDAAQYAPKKEEPKMISSVPSLPGVPDMVPDEPVATGASDMDFEALLAEHNLEEGDQIGQLPATNAGGNLVDDLDLDSFGLGSLGDYSESHDRMH